jgi:hypothetical protein
MRPARRQSEAGPDKGRIDMITTTKRRAALVVVAAALGGLTSYTMFSGTAEAVPTAQRLCKFETKSIASDDGWRQLGLGVTINNGSAPRQVVAQLATDMGVDPGAEVRVGYSIDGGSVREKVFGPGNLANHTEFWETRSTIALIPLPAGVHTVTPYWRISGVSGKHGFFEDGCFTLEGRTR